MLPYYLNLRKYEKLVVIQKSHLAFISKNTNLSKVSFYFALFSISFTFFIFEFFPDFLKAYENTEVAACKCSIK